MDDAVFNLQTDPVHLGLGARVVPQEQFTGNLEWYERYEARTDSDGVEGRLVSMHRYTTSWESWEMHPLGEELVVCTAGTITLLQEINGQVRSAVLNQGEAVINPPGVWHTADVDDEAAVLIITTGIGTKNRPR
ncbi:MAG TPA: cupin [Acidimicrobiales bacterium]|nr:cupin [Acidimicrobiales bacterium]